MDCASLDQTMGKRVRNVSQQTIIIVQETPLKKELLGCLNSKKWSNVMVRREELQILVVLSMKCLRKKISLIRTPNFTLPVMTVTDSPEE